uniref:reticulon-4-interacting protein 1, mitochondrial isoform X2 n=1 Tax=Myxine glutinosa TaxID=7769 RepID=UPI00358F363D
MAFRGFVPGMFRLCVTCSNSGFSNYISRRGHAMSAWVLDKYGGPRCLRRSSRPLPSIVLPNEVVVKVCAASLNPIDLSMARGYGARLLRLRRDPLRIYPTNSEFPLILGRDCSGIVMETGLSVKYFRPGDQVWLALPPWKQGTLAEFVVASGNEISHKPKTLSHTDAASLPFVALTAYAALTHAGGLHSHNTKGKRVLVLGASGGVGLFAVQLLKAWGARVTVTCDEEAASLLSSLGTERVVTREERPAEVLRSERFDFVLDAVGGETETWAMPLLQPWCGATYVTLVTPLLMKTDDLGLAEGFVSSTAVLGRKLISGLAGGTHYRWAFFSPSGSRLDEITTLVDSGKVQPIVEKVYQFDEVPAAFEKLERGRARGKTVVQRA